MSYKLEGLKFNNKKIAIQTIDFNAPRQQLTNLYLPVKKERRFMTRVLKGQEKIIHGRYRIDDNELIGGHFVRSKVAFIRTDKWLERLIPPRVILTLSQLFDINFLRQARLRKNDKKYDYLSFSDSHNDLSNMELRRELDQVISQFVENLMTVEKTLIAKFQQKIEDFNRRQIEKIFKNYYTQIKVLAKEYAELQLKIITQNLLLTFFQALWDQVYSFKDLRNSCPCEYNVDKSSNKGFKKIKTKFTYREPYFMVIKRLKMINIRISELRFLLIRDQRSVKQVRKQLAYELKKYDSQHRIEKIQQTARSFKIQTWEKNVADLRLTFVRTQNDFFYNTLPIEGESVRSRLIFLTHNYHRKVLSGTHRLGKLSEFKLLKKHYQKAIQSVYLQAANSTKDNLERLKIKFDWYVRNGFKLSSLNIIYLKIIRAINMQKNNIVFLDIFNLLTKNDYRNLINTIKNLNREYPNLTLINLTGNFASITDWLHPVFGLENQQLKALFGRTIVQINAHRIADSFAGSWNTFNYTKTADGVLIGTTFWPLPNLSSSPGHKIFINPFGVSLAAPSSEIDENLVPMLLKIKSQNRFLDPHMILGVTKSGVKLIFYSPQFLELNKERIIFLETGAIITL